MCILVKGNRARLSKSGWLMSGNLEGSYHLLDAVSSRYTYRTIDITTPTHDPYKPEVSNIIIGVLVSKETRGVDKVVELFSAVHSLDMS